METQIEIKIRISKKRKAKFKFIFQNLKNEKKQFSFFKNLIFWIILFIHGLSFIFNIWLLNLKRKNEKKNFLNLFWFKTNFKKQKSKFSNSLFDFKSKSEFQKILSFFKFIYERWLEECSGTEKNSRKNEQKFIFPFLLKIQNEIRNLFFDLIMKTKQEKKISKFYFILKRKPNVPVDPRIYTDYELCWISILIICFKNKNQCSIFDFRLYFEFIK